MSSCRLHSAGQGLSVKVASSFKNHVLKEMRNSRAKVGVLMNTAGSNPDLCTNHWGGVVRVKD